jgi:hypothetical protein
MDYNLLKNVLFLDIETVGLSQEFSSLDDGLKFHWLRKASFLKNEEKETPEDLYAKRAAIYAEFGKVICISVAHIAKMDDKLNIRVKSFYGDDEFEVLEQFKELIKSGFNEKEVQLCAHNGKEFDFPYLARRMMVNSIKLPEPLNIAGKKPWEVQHFDTMELWKFGDWKNFTSLDLLANLFKIPSSKSDMDGSMVHGYYYENNDIESIRRYCEKDVIVCTQLFLRMNYLEIIPEERIEVIEK